MQPTEIYLDFAKYDLIAAMLLVRKIWRMRHIVSLYELSEWYNNIRKIESFIGFIGDAGLPGTIVVRVGNNRPDLGTNPICNRYTGPLEEGQPLFLPCNPPMPGAFVSVHLEVATPTDIPVQLSLCEAFVYTDQVSKKIVVK